MRNASEAPQSNVSFSRKRESILDPRISSDSSEDDRRRSRLRLVKAVNELKDSRALPKSFAQALEDLRTERHASRAEPALSGIEGSYELRNPQASKV